jgi:transcriptional regulator with XRE-family HTH domain
LEEARKKMAQSRNELRIKELRLAKGMKQFELAAELTVSQGAVAHWESGRNEPSLRELKNIARVLGTDVSFLTGSPSDGLIPVDFELKSEGIILAETDLMAPAINLSEDVEAYIITIVSTSKYWPTWGEGDYIYARQRQITVKQAIEQELDCMIMTTEGDRHIGKVKRIGGPKGQTSVVVPNSPPQEVDIDKCHPVVWVKKNI